MLNNKTKTAEIIAKAAMGFSKHAANSRCVAIYHQPPMPATMKRLKKY